MVTMPLAVKCRIYLTANGTHNDFIILKNKNKLCCCVTVFIMVLNMILYLLLF